MIFITLWVGHLIGDYFIQTDHQAQHKGLTGDRSWEGRWNCLKHAVTHTMSMAAAYVITALLGHLPATGHSIGVITSILVIDGITHYIIDRRWTLRWFAERIGKRAWIENDAQALPTLDQAAHIIIIFIGSLVFMTLM